MTTINRCSTDGGTVGGNIINDSINDSTLTLTGTAGANSTVRAYDEATLLGDATANASGAWGYTTAALSNGTRSFTAATRGKSK